MLKLSSGKMSSREGNVITGESLIKQVTEKVTEKMADREMSDEEKSVVSEQVAIGAIKYTILKQSIGKDIVFNIEKSISFEGDSGPYLQYSAVRAGSVLEKAKAEGLTANISTQQQLSDLERLLYRFSGVVSKAQIDNAPSHLVTYLTELASSFNNFYAHNTIVGDERRVSEHRVALTEAFRTVMENGLDILGIDIPEKM
jgi:arginyl-tRNA synthetase